MSGVFSMLPWVSAVARERQDMKNYPSCQLCSVAEPSSSYLLLVLWHLHVNQASGSIFPHVMRRFFTIHLRLLERAGPYLRFGVWLKHFGRFARRNAGSTFAFIPAVDNVRRLRASLLRLHLSWRDDRIRLALLVTP